MSGVALRLVRLAAGFGLCAWLSACAGTETGNPSFVGKLGYDAYSSAPSVVALSMALQQAPTDSPVTVDQAWLVLGEVELLSGAECSSHVDVSALGAGDHAGSQVEPTEFAFPEGKYCGVRLPFAPASELPKGAPESLKTESVLVRGKLSDGRAYEVHSQLQESLSLRATAGDFVLDSKHSSVVIGFDVALWLSELSWDAATNSADGSVSVSETSNRALLEQFEAALPRGIALFRDHDGNGVLDSKPEQLAVTQP
jgi:hypothetical protein